MKKNIEIGHIPPIKGAAEYYAGYDYESNKKPCVFMTYVVGGLRHTMVCDYAKTIELARKKAQLWQIKENKAVKSLESKK
jgi:hypothetical protein